MFLTVVYRRDGIVGLDFIQLLGPSAEVAERWRSDVNGIVFNMLRFNASTLTFFKRKWVWGPLRQTFVGVVSWGRNGRVGGGGAYSPMSEPIAAGTCVHQMWQF